MTSVFSLQAQEDIFRRGELSNPELHADQRVTFRLRAPAAKEVTVLGSWLPWGQPAVMQKGEGGEWIYTSEDAFAPDMYWYQFVVDGVRTADPENVQVMRDVGTVWNVFTVGGGQADLYQVNAVPHGSLTFRWYDSPKNDKQRRLAIYTPPGYEAGEETYPVLYLLHGMGGDEEAWIELGRAAQVLDNLIAAGKARPMIVVMPNGNVSQEAAPGEGSSGWVKPSFLLPRTMDGQFEYAFDEIIQFVDTNYRTRPNKSGRAIAGLSMGGFHAVNISRYYPQTFDYMGLFSPALHVDITAYPDAVAYHDVDEKLRQQLANGYQLYWIRVGVEDFPDLLAGIVAHKNKMDALGMPYDAADTPGGHTWKNWRDYLVAFVQLLF